MKVVWSHTAMQDLGEIASWIATDNPAAARSQTQKILGRARQLAQFPHSGRAVVEYDDPSIREVIEGSYRLVYRVRPGRIEVVAVLEGHRLPAPPDEV